MSGWHARERWAEARYLPPYYPSTTFSLLHHRSHSIIRSLVYTGFEGLLIGAPGDTGETRVVKVMVSADEMAKTESRASSQPSSCLVQ